MSQTIKVFSTYLMLFILHLKYYTNALEPHVFFCITSYCILTVALFIQVGLHFKHNLSRGYATFL